MYLDHSLQTRIIRRELKASKQTHQFRTDKQNQTLCSPIEMKVIFIHHKITFSVGNIIPGDPGQSKPPAHSRRRARPWRPLLPHPGSRGPGLQWCRGLLQSQARARRVLVHHKGDIFWWIPFRVNVICHLPLNYCQSKWHGSRQNVQRNATSHEISPYSQFCVKMILINHLFISANSACI